MGEVNELLIRLTNTGWMSGTVILGPAIHVGAYAASERRLDSVPLTQVVLTMPGGVGVALWDSEDHFAAAESEGGLEAETRLHFEPFDDCDALTKALILPHIDDLMRRLREQVDSSRPR